MKNIYEKFINLNRSLLLFLLFTVGIFSSNLFAQCTGGRYYVRDTEPWGQTSNVTAMNSTFGSGNWTQGTFSTSAATIFSSSNCFVMIEGSQNNSGFPAFMTTNQTLIENWVAAGGKLLINAAPNYNFPSDPFSLGFGGVTISRLTGQLSNIPVVTVTG
jgi:hypothetical protein